MACNAVIAGICRVSTILQNFDMQFLTLARRRTDAFPPEAFTPELLAVEGRHLTELNAAGILQQIWLRGDLPGAAMMKGLQTIRPLGVATGTNAVAIDGKSELEV